MRAWWDRLITRLEEIDRRLPDVTGAEYRAEMGIAPPLPWRPPRLLRRYRWPGGCANCHTTDKWCRASLDRDGSGCCPNCHHAGGAPDVRVHVPPP